MEPLNNIPKKRGRKPKKKNEDNIVQEKPLPKKRGRKPKKKSDDLVKEKAIPKKRGRKPKKKIYNIIEIEKSNNINNNDNIILHLPIKLGDIDKNNNTSDLKLGNISYNPTIPNIPQPYDISENVNKLLCSNPNLNSTQNINLYSNMNSSLECNNNNPLDANLDQ